MSSTTSVAPADANEQRQADAIVEHFLVSPSASPPLRVGVLLDSMSLPRCFEQVIDHVQRSNFATIELLMVHTPAAVLARKPHRTKLRILWDVLSDPEYRKQIGYAIYSKLDDRFFLGADDPLAVVDCTDRLSGIEQMKIAPIVKGFIHRFRAADIEEIRKRKLDVILRFGFNILRGDILWVAQYGVWSFHHGDNDYYRGGPPYLWELRENNDLCGVVLQRLNDELDAGLVLAKGQFASIKGTVSRVQNRFTPYWGSIHFVIRKLWELHNYGWDHLERHAVPQEPYQGRRKIYRSPVNSELLAWLARPIAMKSARRLAAPFTGDTIPRWRIALRVAGMQQLYRADQPDYLGFTWLEPPDGHFHADPFLIEDRGRVWMFFEDYLYCESRAAIACREVLPGGRVGEPRTVLKRPYHLSYPFVFRHAGDFYMIPESADNGTVELYRAERFPYEWRREKILFQGKAVDTTMVEAGDTFWFFTTIQAVQGTGMALCLFHSDRIDGEWKWHPASPITMDVRDARCGGPVFRHDGKLIRVSQDCSGHYGRSFSFREILTLTKTEYRESLVRTVEPWSRSLVGTHTYGSCFGFEVIDGVTYVPKSRHMKPAELSP